MGFCRKSCDAEENAVVFDLNRKSQNNPAVSLNPPQDGRKCFLLRSVSRKHSIRGLSGAGRQLVQPMGKLTQILQVV